ARMLAIRRRRWKGDDRATSRRCNATADEIELPADRAEIASPGDLGVGLPRQIDLDRRIDRMEARQRGHDREVVRVIGAAHVDRTLALGEVTQPLRSEEAAGDGASGIAPLVRVGDDAALDEIDEHVGYDTAVHAELTVVRERARDGC